MKDPNRFYTYAYLRLDKTPYYIGKGEGRRIYKKGKREIHPPRDKSRIIYLKQNLTEEKAFQHEKYMIAVFGRKDLGTGILRNRTNGGDGPSGHIKSPETISKLRGRKHTEETRKKLCEIQKKKWTTELRKKMSDMKKGIPIPEERKKKISLAHMGKVVSESTKQKLKEYNIKYLYEIKDPEGNVYETNSLNEFCKMNGLDTAAMQRVCFGKQKSHTPKRKDRIRNKMGWTVRILDEIS